MKNIEKALETITDNERKVELAGISCQTLLRYITGKTCKLCTDCNYCPMNTIGSMLDYLNSERLIKLTRPEYIILKCYNDHYDNICFSDVRLLNILKCP